MTKIEQLENEISQKINELNESKHAQHLLRETLKSNTKTLVEIGHQLKIIESHLKDSNEYIDELKQQNRKLKLSCDVWVQRAIKLEFEVLNARDAANK